MNIEDGYNFTSLLTGEGIPEGAQVQDLMKAMSAGAQTGRDLDGTITSGASLKTESLEPMLKILTNRDAHIKFWKMVPKSKAYNTVEEFNQLIDYGLDVGIFNQEGETPQFTDSLYRRESQLVKYTGVSGEVTHPFTLTRLGSGVGDALATEVYNKTQFLIRALDKSLWNANSDMVSNEFDGIAKQHYDGIGTSLATYWADSVVIDARGAYLTDAMIEDAVHGAVNDNFGMVSEIIAPPVVFKNYVKQFHESKRINVGTAGAVSGATMGQSVNQIQTQMGLINVNNDIFFNYKAPKLYNAAATSTKAPTVPVFSALTAETDTSNLFGATYAGNYFYAVTSKNRYGESSMVTMNTTTLAIALTESADLTWTHTDGAYAAESFVIYRVEKDTVDYTTAKYYPIFTVSVAEWTAGYDGGSAGVVADRNREISNTYDAWVFENSEELYTLRQLAPIMRMDLARTSPSFRFMVLAYVTPILFAPKKSAVIKNIGARGL